MRTYQVQNFRTAMSWVHAWGGLLFGWLLFAVFTLGTLSYFRQEITLWMQPELQQASISSEQQGLEKAVNYLQQQAADAGRWSITLPNPRSSALQLSWGEAGQRRGGVQLYMDPASGDIIQPRATAGGDFLYHFHYQLYGLGRAGGEWIVGIATMVMFVAIITGIIVHKNIIKDFFTFRPGKGKRSWLDAHNASAVFGLPFFLIITLSGLLLLGMRLMPAAEWAAYAGSGMTMRQDMKGGMGGQEQHGPGQSGGMERGQRESGQREGSAREGGTRETSRADTRGDWQTQEHPQRGRPQNNEDNAGWGNVEQPMPEHPQHRQPQNNEENSAAEWQQKSRQPFTENADNPRFSAQNKPWSGSWQENTGHIKGTTISATSLRVLLQRAAKEWPHNSVARITVENPGRRGSTVSLQQAGSDSLSGRGMPQQLTFDAASGRLLPQQERGHSMTEVVNSTLQAIHLGAFAVPFLRWLLFLSGIGGCLMIATGLVLWVVTNGQKNTRAQAHKSPGDRVVEILNIGAVAGLLLAVAAYFWSNRLIAAGNTGREGSEITVFFAVWGLSFIYAVLRRHKAAWTELLTLCGALLVLLPLLNGVTGGAHLGVSIARGQLQVAAFDIAAFVLGLALLFAARRVWIYQPRARAKQDAGESTC